MEEKINKKTKNRKVYGILLSLMVSVVLYIVLLLIDANILGKDAEFQVKTYEIVVESLDKYTQISEANWQNFLKESVRDSRELPSNYITDITELFGLFTQRVLYKREILTKETMVAIDPTKGIKNPIEVSLGVSNIGQVVGGTIREGDVIAIDVVREDTLSEDIDVSYLTKPTYISETIIEKCIVTGVFTSTGNPILLNAEEAQNPATVICVVISKEQEGDFNIAMEKGTIRISKYLYK